MPRKLTQEELRQLRELKERYLLTVQFMVQHGVPESIAAPFREGVEDAYARGDIRELRNARRDFTDWINSLSQADQENLEVLLRTRVGTDLRGEREADLVKVRQIMARGRIQSEVEYHLLRSRLDEIGTDPVHSDEARRLDALVIDYGLKP